VLVKTPPPELASRLREASPDILRLGVDPNFDEVSERTGVARATLYYYFSGRDDLLAFLLTSHLEEGAALFSSVDGDEPVQHLQRVLEAMVEFLASRPGVCAGLISALGSGTRMDEVLRANEKIVAGPIREILERGESEGAFVFDDARDTANAFTGAILTVVLGRAVGDRPLDEPDFPSRLASQLLSSVSVR
jgi:TetR/AcrR family transcriptional regulator